MRKPRRTSDAPATLIHACLYGKKVYLCGTKKTRTMISATTRETGRPPVPEPPAAFEAGDPSVPALPCAAPRPEGEEDRLLGGVFEVNERCLEMLVNAARQEPEGSFALVRELREILNEADPAVRRRAACRSFLLVDMEFGNADWWRGAASHLSEPARLPYWRRSFPRATGTQLARAVILLAWNSLRLGRDPAATRLLLGMTPEVSAAIATLRFDQIDRIAQKRFRFVRPRWDDRPAVWRRLLCAARSGDAGLMAAFNVHGLQLLSGELIESMAARE
jgi:hypothetical protein